MAEQPFPLPLTDGDGVIFPSLFLENWCDGNNNLQIKLQESPPVYVSAPIRQTPHEGPAPDTHMQVPCWDLFSAILTIWLVSHTDPVTLSWHLIPAHFSRQIYPCQHPSLECQLLPLLKGCVEALKAKTRAGTVTRPHTKKSDFFLLHFNQNQSYCLW